MPDRPRVIDLGYRERPWQQRVSGSLQRFSVLVVHSRAGKTTLAVMRLIDAALKLQRPDGQYAYIAPELKQAKRNAWGFLKQFATRIPGTVVYEAELYVKLPNGSKIWLFGADNPDALRGIYLDGAVLDEIAQMKPETWGEIVSVRLMDRHGWALFIGTPKGINMLSELYYSAQRNPEWYAGLFTWRETAVFTENEIEEQRKLMTPAQFRQELECAFDAAAENQIIPFDLVAAAAGKHLRAEQYDFAAKVIGVDVAFSETGDRSVIFRRQGLASFTPDLCERGVDNMTLAARVAEVATLWKADAIFVDSGRGEGVISRLVQLGFRPIPVNFGGSANAAHFLNKRAEILWAVREWLEDGGALPDRTDIRQDFCGITYSRTRASDKIQAESNDDLKARGLPSPDTLCALACTFAAPVEPAALANEPLAVGRRVETEWEPFR